MKVVPKRRWRYPIALEREYDKRLTAFVEQNMEIVKQFVPDMAELLLLYAAHVDAEGSSIIARLDILIDRISRAVHDAGDFRRTVENIYSRVSAYNQAEWEAIIKSVLGAPLRAFSFQKIQQDDEADDMLRELWVEDNLSLIRSIDLQTRERIRNMLREKILGNVSRRELVLDLTAEIERIAGLERNRAALIARDQVGKLNGQLTHFRQTNAGIEEYEWRSSRDSRVRPTHRDFDGQIYSWRGTRQAPEGPPGWPIRCRCVGLPVIDLDRIVTKPVPGSYDIAKVKDVEQRKTNAFYEITDEAIRKIKKMEVPGFSQEQHIELQELHRNVLRTAHRTNNDNEVLLVQNKEFSNLIIIKGTKNSVNYVDNIDLQSLYHRSYRYELIFSHNHPSTAGFSLADIKMFLINEYIGLFTVVTNQGQIFLLQKGPNFDYNKAKDIWNEVIRESGLNSKNVDSMLQQKTAKNVLAKLKKAGVIYEKTNK